MSPTMNCSHCGQPLGYGPELFGKPGQCPSCGHQMIFPTPPGRQVAATTAGAGAICEACGDPRVPEITLCPDCGHEYDSPRPEPVPWEGAIKSNWWGPLKETVRLMFTDSAAFYRRMPTSGNIAKPMFFAAILGTVSLWAVTLTMMLGMMAVFIVLGVAVDDGPPPIMAVMFPIQMIFGMIMAPVQVLIGIFINAGILHVCQMILKLGKKGFESTFRVVCYSHSIQALMLIPIFGWLVAPIWQIVVIIIGLREVNNTTTGKATLAFFMPWIFMCCLMMLAYGAMVVLFVALAGVAAAG